MTPEQAIEFLVDTVNFERANAEGEVRRSFSGQYAPLYQAAYMLGGLQLRALHRGAGRVGTDDEPSVPRRDSSRGARCRSRWCARGSANVPLTRAGAAPWRFAEQLPAPVPFGLKP